MDRSHVTVLANLYAQLGPLIERVNAVQEEMYVIKKNITHSFPSTLVGQKRLPERYHGSVLKKRRTSADSTILLLPDEILLKILRLLDIRSLLSFAVTCKDANFAVNEEMLWFPIQHRYFRNIECLTFPAKNGDNIPSVMSKRMLALKNWREIKYQQASLVLGNIKIQACMHPILSDSVYLASKNDILELNTITGDKLSNIPIPSNCVDFCCDSNNIYVSSTDIVRVFDTKTKELKYSINELMSHGNRIKVSQNHLAVGLWDGNIKIFNPEHGRLISSIPGHKSPIHSLSGISKDIIASGSSDRTIKLWNIQGKSLCSLTDHTKTVTAIELCQGASHIISGSKDCQLKYWDIQSETCIQSYTNPVDITTLSWRGESIFISGDSLGNLFIWDIRTQSKPVCALKNHTSSIVAATLSEKKLVSCDSSKRVAIWDFSRIVPDAPR
mmetsp:Transcript_37988/g.81823  ORF Transcript_37988/g.81823 Transcript_37988/m.81823 type:complete len:442 (+) Transcript_37988:98-1423(+)